MNNKLKPTARKTDLVILEADDEMLVYDLTTNKASCLNETSAFIWQNCDGSNSIADIASALGRRSNDQVNDELVWLAIDELSKHRLIEEDVSSYSAFGELSRREVIKKVGLGTMLALPVIATVIAPKAVYANSACIPVAGGCTCPNGTVGQICAPTLPCADVNCRCLRINNGGPGNGDCVP